MDKMENKAYAAAVEFAVSDRSKANAWKHLAEWVTVEAQSKAVSSLERELVDIEQSVKTDLHMHRMPSSWRSAKSVALTAASLGVSLIDASGAVKGKSAISKEIKERTLGSVAALSDFANRVSAMEVAYSKLSPVDVVSAIALLVSSPVIRTILKS